MCIEVACRGAFGENLEIHVFLNADVVHDQALVLAGIDAVDAGNRLDKAVLLDGLVDVYKRQALLGDYWKRVRRMLPSEHLHGTHRIFTAS